MQSAKAQCGAAYRYSGAFYTALNKMEFAINSYFTFYFLQSLKLRKRDVF
jgi:hypothetical protein